MSFLLLFTFFSLYFDFQWKSFLSPSLSPSLFTLFLSSYPFPLSASWSVFHSLPSLSFSSSIWLHLLEKDDFVIIQRSPPTPEAFDQTIPLQSNKVASWANSVCAKPAFCWAALASTGASLVCVRPHFLRVREETGEDWVRAREGRERTAKRWWTKLKEQALNLPSELTEKAEHDGCVAWLLQLARLSPLKWGWSIGFVLCSCIQAHRHASLSVFSSNTCGFTSRSYTRQPQESNSVKSMSTGRLQAHSPLQKESMRDKVKLNIGYYNMWYQKILFWYHMFKRIQCPYCGYYLKEMAIIFGNTCIHFLLGEMGWEDIGTFEYRAEVCMCLA